MMDNAAMTALVEAARRVRANAPYSGYRLGTALRSVDGCIFTGVNVENSAYPTSICAETNALTTAVTAGVFVTKRILTGKLLEGGGGE